ncbi:MAG: ice-binding family protein [Vicinamibacteria bacterium]
MGAADAFAVLGGTAVTCTNSVIDGDVGVDLGGAITRTNCTLSGAVHNGDVVAQQAYDDFLAKYAALALVPCDFNLTGQPLSGQSLTPGVYCFDAAVTETGGVLTLNGSSTDTWIFKIGTGGTGALTGTNFTVVMSSGEACNNNVSWWTAEAATLTDSVFVGSIFAGTSITVTRGSLDGQALAKAAVTLTSTSVCGGLSQPPQPKHCTIKVTGGGQIAVPNPNSKDRATFGFNAKGEDDGTATGHFNYVNHLTGLHVNGPVDHVAVIATNPDGSPKTVRFSGTCGGNSPACAFVATVQDNGEPGGRIDVFGVTVTGARSEVVSPRLISRGNIQLHKQCHRRGNHEGDGDDDDSCHDDHDREDGKTGGKKK